MQTLFWLLGGLVAYVYLGYPLLMAFLSKVRPAKPVRKGSLTPVVSLIIAAYNEEKTLKDKLDNCLALNYPREKLEVLVVSDGSTDATAEIAGNYAGKGVRLLSLPANQGKSSAQNTGVHESHGDILLFTDADVMLQPNAVRRIVENFADSDVGCVVGKITYANEKDSSVTQGESAYWRYELFLRTKESEVGNLAAGSGVMAIRRNLFRPLDPRIGEDFVLPIWSAVTRHRVVYEAAAVTRTLLHQTTAADMFKTKVRVISKDLRGLFHCPAILNPFRYPLHAWGLLSHKLLRWLVPYCLIALLIISLALLENMFYCLALSAQLAFYALAAAGCLWQRKGRPPQVLGIPFSFCLVNAAALVGVSRCLTGKISGHWQPIRTVKRRTEDG